MRPSPIRGASAGKPVPRTSDPQQQQQQSQQPPAPSRARLSDAAAAGDAAAAAAAGSSAAAGLPPLPRGSSNAGAAAAAAGGLADVVAAAREIEGALRGKAQELAGMLLKVIVFASKIIAPVWWCAEMACVAVSRCCRTCTKQQVALHLVTG